MWCSNVKWKHGAETEVQHDSKESAELTVQEMLIIVGNDIVSAWVPYREEDDEGR